MLKQIIKTLLGEKNVSRIRRVKSSINAAKTTWQNFNTNTRNESQQKILSCLMSVHMLEKAMVMNNTKYLNAVNYDNLLENIANIIESGRNPEIFETAGSIAIIKSALNSLPEHEYEKLKLADIIAKYNVHENFSGGVKTLSREQIFMYNNFDFHGFVSSRHSIRKFKNKIIERKIIQSIINDAKFYPSACNRQPCKIYYSCNEQSIARIIKAIPDTFVTKEVHDAFIVTCDRNLLYSSELNDQEFVDSGIFLAFLVLSIHAHGLGSCIFQFLQADRRQAKIKREFNIKDNEVITAFIGFGEVEDENVIACAQRRPNDSIMIDIDNSPRKI